MNALASSLLVLQQADSFFPGGATAWSWGLETLVADGRLGVNQTSFREQHRGRKRDRSAQVSAFIEGQLRYRWSCFDRAFLCAAWQAADDITTLMDFDSTIEALTLAEELRHGSRKVGQSLLRVHVALGTPDAECYQHRVIAGETPGHLPIVQGLLWRRLGMLFDHCQLAAAHGLCTGLVSAAVRLGIMGHIDAQRVLTDTQPILLDLLGHPPPKLEDVIGFTPMAEIAVMRHETQDLRLFAN
ncbi:MAG: urease accessory protein UreF [Azoarcus sp. PHD]|nr:MAG: urease accessory protein UreF [Azoarcus sp. PHD]